jgi:UPF0755 protein
MYIKRIVLIIAIIGLIGGSAFAYMVYSAFFMPNTAFMNKEAFLYIPSEADFSEVKVQIEPLLEDLDSFEAAAERKGYAANVKAGKYRILKGMNNNDIINTLRSANIPVRVSFNNQETLGALAGRIADQIEADSLSLLQSMKDTSFLIENGVDLEDALSLYIPNSYEFFWNTSAKMFRERMLKEYHKFWNEDRKASAANLGLTPTEVIILASIVHKETAKVEERPRVAGVYLNRLKKGMLLQADPTVIFALKKELGNQDTIIKRVLYKDLELNSPYNTYKYAGLPPGPIAMPDISAIDAVLHPEKHNYYYFVANVERFGYHMFAETLAQHNRNKEQYVRWVNSQKIKR